MADRPTDPPSSHPILLPHRGTVLGMALARSDEMAFLWSFHCPLHSFGRIGQTCLCPPLRLALLRSGIGLVVVPSLAPEEHCERERV